MENEILDWRGAELPEAVVLDGNWVRLEPLDAGRHGATLWGAVQGADEVWDYLGDGPYATEAAFTEAIAGKAAGTAARFWAILPEGSQEAAGYASLMRMDPANGVIEVGNILYSPGLQRTRASTEAMYLLAGYVFEALGYRRYEWKCNARNEPSRKAAGRLGFRFEGIFRQHMVVKGQNRDTAWFSMLDGEWPERRERFESWLGAENFDETGRQVRRLAS
jgi:RimJ/RimL family protein N-acetyltransferase